MATAPQSDIHAVDTKAHETEDAHMELEKQHATAADVAEHTMTYRQAVRSYWKAILWSMTFSMALIMESYVLQVMAAFNAQPAFQRTFGVPIGGGKYELEAQWQAALANASKVGIIIGLFTNGFVIDRFGCKRVMLTALFFFLCFNFVIFFAKDVRMLFAGEFLVGLPLGIFNTLASLYAVEVCPMVLRGSLTAYVNLCWVIGHLIGAGVLQSMATRTDEWAYRIPFAIQWMWPAPLLVICCFAPESPWWLVRKGRCDEAIQALGKLSVPGVMVDNPATVALMERTIEHEHRVRIGASYRDIFRTRNGSLRRFEIAAVCYSTHTWSGFILQNYVTYFFKSAGLPTADAYKLSLGCYAISFVATCCCFAYANRIGRRLPFIAGYIIMTSCMYVIGGLAFGQGSQMKWAQAGVLLTWFAFYGLTNGPLPYIIAAEIPSVKLRSKTLNASRMFYYCCDIVNGTVGPYAINPTKWNLQGKAAFIPAAISTCLIVWAYFRLPETAGKTPEDLDLLFEEKVPARQFAKYDTTELKARAHMSAFA